MSLIVPWYIEAGAKIAKYKVWIILGLILLLITGIGAGIQSCRNKSAQKKDEINKEEILKDKGKIEVVGENRNASLENANAAAAESEKANANYERTRGVDSSTRDGNFGSVRGKWCEDYPRDSKCR